MGWLQSVLHPLRACARPIAIGAMTLVVRVRRRRAIVKRRDGLPARNERGRGRGHDGQIYAGRCGGCRNAAPGLRRKQNGEKGTARSEPGIDGQCGPSREHKSRVGFHVFTVRVLPGKGSPPVLAKRADEPIPFPIRKEPWPPPRTPGPGTAPSRTGSAAWPPASRRSS